MAISKLTSPVTQNDAINKINEVIDNIGSGGTSPSPSSSTPLMDGTAAVGTSTDYARGDHRHPSDTAKADKASTVTNVAYDSTDEKLTQTINGTTADIVTLETLADALRFLIVGLTGKGAITNFDSTTTSGFYTYSSSATSRPPVNAGGACLVLHASSAFITQIAFPNRSSSTAAPTFYIRRSYSAGNWQAWYSITPVAT